MMHRHAHEKPLAGLAGEEGAAHVTGTAKDRPASQAIGAVAVAGNVVRMAGHWRGSQQ